MLALVADLAAAVGIAWGWRRRDALVYLLIGTPLLAFSYQRFDYVPIAFAVWAMALLVRRGDDPRAGVAFGLAILAKLWPVVLLPVLVLRRARRAMVGTVVTLGVAGLAWVAISGPKAPFQVISFRGATGWAIESTVGNLVWIVTGGQIYPQAGAARIGDAPSWAKGVLLAVPPRQPDPDLAPRPPRGPRARGRAPRSRPSSRSWSAPRCSPPSTSRG